MPRVFIYTFPGGERKNAVWFTVYQPVKRLLLIDMSELQPAAAHQMVRMQQVPVAQP